MVDVRVEGLEKRYRDVVAVDGVSFTVDEGEFVTLVGPSGSGKTTTIRLISGLEKPTGGRILFGDFEVTNTPPQERNVAMMFQNVSLYPHMSVRENMAYGLKIEGMSQADRNAKVEEVAEWLQIRDLLANNPTELSGGQQQRVALGRSIVRDPNVFLFDEPMSDLDAALKQELRPLVQEVTQEIGCPTIYVTHDQEEAMTMSDNIIIMHQGGIRQIGTPHEVYNEPESRFVGQFIGQPQMQFFQGKVVEDGDGYHFQIADFTWDLPAADGLESYVGDTVELGIRPQDIDIDGPENGGIPADHSLDEPLGDRTICFFETPLGRVTVVTSPEFQGDQQQHFLHLNEHGMKLFDVDSGLRIV